MVTKPPGTKAGTLLKEWRLRRGRSQLDLAVDVGISPRHLSFVETGRSKPSPELLLVLAERLEVPLRERNAFLLAAGCAPRYAETSLDDAEMRRVRAALQRMLDGHDPYPGVVIDRLWNVMLSNDAARGLVDLLPPELAASPLNVFRACLHPASAVARPSVSGSVRCSPVDLRFRGPVHLLVTLCPVLCRPVRLQSVCNRPVLQGDVRVHDGCDLGRLEARLRHATKWTRIPRVARSATATRERSRRSAALVTDRNRLGFG
jgi:transcriptional regulator with XRE-family HTH domain